MTMCENEDIDYISNIDDNNNNIDTNDNTNVDNSVDNSNNDDNVDVDTNVYNNHNDHNETTSLAKKAKKMFSFMLTTRMSRNVKTDFFSTFGGRKEKKLESPEIEDEPEKRKARAQVLKLEELPMVSHCHRLVRESTVVKIFKKHSRI